MKITNQKKNCKINKKIKMILINKNRIQIYNLNKLSKLNLIMNLINLFIMTKIK